MRRHGFNAYAGADLSPRWVARVLDRPRVGRGGEGFGVAATEFGILVSHGRHFSRISACEVLTVSLLARLHGLM